MAILLHEGDNKINNLILINDVDRIVINKLSSHLSLSEILGTLRLATARGHYGYVRSKSLPVTSARELQYGFPAVASFSAASNCLLCRTLHYVSINCHFFAILKLVSLF